MRVGAEFRIPKAVKPQFPGKNDNLQTKKKFIWAFKNQCSVFYLEKAFAKIYGN